MITAIQKPKRKYGEGSIYQRNDGRWVAKYKSANMLKPCVVYAKSESEAKRKLRELKRTLQKVLSKAQAGVSVITPTSGYTLSSCTRLRTAASTNTKVLI